MTDLNLIRTFCKLAEFGSFTQAARVLKQPKSRVSRAISRLEEDLGVELVRRTTRQTSLTGAGQKFYQRVQLLISQLDEESNAISETKDEMEGILKVTSPEDIGQSLLSKVVAVFNKKYPKVKIETVLSNEVLDLTKEGIDVAIRAGKLVDSNLKQRRLIEFKMILVASKKYLQTFGRPMSLPDLKRHKLMFFRDFGLEPVLEKRLKSDDLESYLKCDSFSMLLTMALEDGGITVLPEFVAQKYIDLGVLQRVLPMLEGKKAHLHLVFPPSKKMPRRTRAFIDTAFETLN